ncbi:hypothetical protein M427DRAFT_136199 [Gonapodya prolifera JEL478]|uniref:Uncharacterized protein n=1 Tax=Gonapodya prolifera (strain JEL478) TaxID=1344416 RepID=A0A139AAY8_GONPJ|nr:hypothetical protein M427DRAFT_136199 [Gonapodya prolifera JEL478]|eukprot:KXS13907.1 hypothetical protein M427DRAFT_136199 [Gonapodya prolifera JEL478]
MATLQSSRLCWRRVPIPTSSSSGKRAPLRPFGIQRCGKCVVGRGLSLSQALLHSQWLEGGEKSENGRTSDIRTSTLQINEKGGSISLVDPTIWDDVEVDIDVRPQRDIVNLLLAHGATVSDAVLAAAEKQDNSQFLKMLKVHLGEEVKEDGVVLGATTSAPMAQDSHADISHNKISLIEAVEDGKSVENLSLENNVFVSKSPCARNGSRGRTMLIRDDIRDMKSPKLEINKKGGSVKHYALRFAAFRRCAGGFCPAAKVKYLQHPLGAWGYCVLPSFLPLLGSPTIRNF